MCEINQSTSLKNKSQSLLQGYTKNEWIDSADWALIHEEVRINQQMSKWKY